MASYRGTTLAGNTSKLTMRSFSNSSFNRMDDGTYPFVKPEFVDRLDNPNGGGYHWNFKHKNRKFN